MAKTTILTFENPFSDDFLQAWDYWKTFKKQQFKFNYKPIGEQAAINDLYEMSKGDEETAKQIIKQSIVKGWQGLFPVKNAINGGKQSANNNGKNQPVTGQSLHEAHSKYFGK